MTELHVSQLPAIVPLFEEAVKDYGDVDVDYTLSQIDAGMKLNKAVVIVDDAELPHAFIIAVSELDATSKGSLCVIPLLYAHLDFRSLGLLRELMNAAAAFAKRKGCKKILTSSWVYRGLKNATGELWAALGFEEQETIYVRDIP